MDDASVKNWLDDLKNAAYQMEDVLDEWATEIRLLQLEKKSHHEVSSSYLCSPFTSCFKQTALRHNIGYRIKDIRETLDTIREEKDQFQFNFQKKNKKTSEKVFEGLQNEGTKTTHIMVDQDILGRDEDKYIILNKLLGIESSNSHQNDETSDPCIISIIGMGGLGKTTLAQLVFNHRHIKTHFEIRMWVCVSDPFDRTMVAKAMIREATNKEPKTLEWNALYTELCESVRGKKFFLVLDDVWTEHPDNLDPLKHLLKLGKVESRMLVTTRNENVASSINSWKHKLKILSLEDSESLLCRRAFRGKEKKQTAVLKSISLGISKKCDGLPLALRLLGSLLNKRIDEESWRHVLNSKFWELKGFDDEKLLHPAFLLSYDGLSSNLKNCFAYCSIFQKDEKIIKSELIELWMAQGLLNSEEPELLGEIVFDELAARSFFQDVSVDDNGNIVFAMMHDLIHDFALFLTNPCYISRYNDDEFCFEQENGSKPIHLSLIYDKRAIYSKILRKYVNNSDSVLGSFRESIEKVCNVRTLQCMRSSNLFEVGNLSSDLIHHLKCLRVLKLRNMGITHLPGEIGKLIHLRYLDLSHNQDLQELPNSVCRLINLQTLKLECCRELHQLPGDMAGMIRLRNFDIRGCERLIYLPKGIGNWRSLRTLSEFIISSTSEGCKFEDLQYLNLLKDCLEINGLQRLRATDEASKVQLHKKSQLSELLLDFKPKRGMPRLPKQGERGIQRLPRQCDVEQTPDDVLVASVLGVLWPHSNLKNLTISNYSGLEFPSWMGNKEALTHLRCLQLNRCINCSELPALGLLPSLEVLHISELLNLKHIGVEIYGGGKCIPQVVFPKLKILDINHALSLEVWEFGNEQVQVASIMPCVTSIDLKQCKTLKALPALGKLPSLQNLSIYDSDQLVSIGHEFCGPEGSSSLSSLTAFPKLNILKFSCLRNLEVMNLGEMPCLKILDIYGCDKLKSLRFRTNKSLPSLETLNLSAVGNLEEFNFGEVGEEENSIWQLPRLFKIHFQGCENLKSFPRHLPSLRGLYAQGFPSLMSGCQPYLPISPNLISLDLDRYDEHSTLHLGNIADFKELKQLMIRGVPDELFKAGDWSILSYIPLLSINYYKIDRLTYSSISNQIAEETEYIDPGKYG
ncbi:hypothetical protein MKW92_032183 [Papaver armeniacum]|nr:hypothetical protein MKW92_032183 [Papaver armeniacum]